MTTIGVRWAFADQLGPHFDDGDHTILIEALQPFRRAPIHRAKAHLILSALRHRARELGDRGTMIRADDYSAALRNLPTDRQPRTVIDPTSHAARRLVRQVPGLQVLPSRGFLSTSEEFDTWAGSRTRLVMEDWYRHVRSTRGILMTDSGPVGGTWNLDSQNRQPPPRGQRTLGLPAVEWPVEDDIDDQVRADLDAWARAGTITLIGDDGPRRFAATRTEALAALSTFIDSRLAMFGPFEDAILAEDQTMAHSLLSVPMNHGLLHPGEVIAAVLDAWQESTAPLNSVEGMIRQIAGWREFVWHCYWRFGPEYTESNVLDANAPLPRWFAELSSDDVGARCLSTTLRAVREWGWTHHIPRLMILGNWALQRGYHPADVNDWYARSFVDGFAWVMPANVIGMALYADGGRMSTKPYVAGGAYINRMSDLCRGCRYLPTVRVGDRACPFTAGYWAFLDRHADLLSTNHRMSRPLGGLARLADRADVVAQEQARGDDPP